MGRPSLRHERRGQIVRAFGRVLAQHGYAGATMIAVADEAGVSAGLLHHHFCNKRDMLNALLDDLMRDFSARTRSPDNHVSSWVSGALGQESGDEIIARCWVGIFGEALRDPALFQRLQRLIGDEVAALRGRPGHQLKTDEASSMISFAVGALVVGAFRPDLTDGQSAKHLMALIGSFPRTDGGNLGNRLPIALSEAKK